MNINRKHNSFSAAFDFPPNDLIDGEGANNVNVINWIAKCCNDRLMNSPPMLIERWLSNEEAELCIIAIGWPSINPHLNTVG